MCGEAGLCILVLRPVPGPSPRVRGSRRYGHGGLSRTGSIPACAGKPWAIGPLSSSTKVHPRVCGEAWVQADATNNNRGPSPRVRGSRSLTLLDRRAIGSIPACAGKPRATHVRARGDGVHPRVCGEAAWTSAEATHRAGPSPRVRGSPPGACAPRPLPGSIPACAGKPRWPETSIGWNRVHPRVCGEARAALDWLSLGQGPSPRVRGSPPVDVGADSRCGSIPACAGKPRSSATGPAAGGVHPRVCGEAPVTVATWFGGAGPSPRVRGSPYPAGHGAVMDGSIPACAGKPDYSCGVVLWGRVHPRVCGEALRGVVGDGHSSGPSPRVRGSPTTTPPHPP